MLEKMVSDKHRLDGMDVRLITDHRSVLQGLCGRLWLVVEIWGIFQQPTIQKAVFLLPVIFKSSSTLKGMDRGPAESLNIRHFSLRYKDRKFIL